MGLPTLVVSCSHDTRSYARCYRTADGQVVAVPPVEEKEGQGMGRTAAGIGPRGNFGFRRMRYDTQDYVQGQGIRPGERQRPDRDSFQDSFNRFGNS